MPSNYIGRAALDNDSTIPDDPFTDGVSTGHNGHHTNIGGAVRAVEAFLGTGSTTSPPGGGQTLISTSAGQLDYGAPPAGTPASTVVADTSYGRVSTVGTTTPYARGDHDHGSPGVSYEVAFTFDTVTSPLTGSYKYRVEVPSTLIGIRCVMGTPAGSGSACTVDLLKNGSTMISAGKPSITVGQNINTNAQTFSTTTLATDDLLSVNLSTGSDGFQLAVYVRLQATSPAGVSASALDASWGANDQGFVTWNFDPNSAAGSSLLLVSGTIYIGAVPVRQTRTITNLWCHVGVLGSGLTASQSFMGLYSSNGTTGTLLSATADMSGDFTTTGTKSKALTTPQLVGPGIYYIAVVSNGTTPPSLARGTTVSNALPNAANLTAATARWATNGSGTSLPSSLTMASNTTSTAANAWYAAS